MTNVCKKRTLISEYNIENVPAEKLLHFRCKRNSSYDLRNYYKCSENFFQKFTIKRKRLDCEKIRWT